MGHNHSTPPRNKLNRKSNSTNCKLSTIKTQPHNTGDRKVRLTLKLPLSQPSLSSEASSSPRFSASISSVQSADFNCHDEVSPVPRTIKDLMIDRLNTKTAENASASASRSNSKLLPTTPNAADYEKFFISFHQKQQQISADTTLYDATIQHRVAFISLVGLYQSFRRIPTHILFSSLFILKIRREWLYEDAQTQNVLHSLQYDQDEEFMMLLKWKDSQGLLLCMWHPTNEDETEEEDHTYQPSVSTAPNRGDTHHDSDIDLAIDDTDELPMDFGIESDANDEEDPNQFVPPLPRLARHESQYNVTVVPRDETHDGNDGFTAHEPNAMWMQLSHQLSGIYDPYQGSNYSPLILNPNWWFNECEQSQYGASSNDVLDEIYQCHMKYRCVMEILFQSNPSLIPCKTYRELEHVSTTAHRTPRPKKIELSEINAISSTISVVDSTTDYLDDDIIYTPCTVHDYDDLDLLFQI